MVRVTQANPWRRVPLKSMSISKSFVVPSHLIGRLASWKFKVDFQNVAHSKLLQYVLRTYSYNESEHSDC